MGNKYEKKNMDTRGKGKDCPPRPRRTKYRSNL